MVEALAATCPQCRAGLPAGARFCPFCGQAVNVTADDQARLSRLAAAAPAPLVARARAAAQYAGERRPATVLVAEIAAIPQDHAPRAGEWAALANQALDQLSAAIYRYEGTIAGLLGDALVAFFGAPVAHEDDTVRAAYASLDLLAATAALHTDTLAEHSFTLSIRIGLHSGHVATGPVGPALTYAYTAEGDTVITAVQLQSTARPMSVLVSPAVQRFLAPLFVCTPVPGQPAFELVGPRAMPGRVRGLAGLESPLVGRGAELSTLLGLSAAVHAGLGRAVVILGEPGIGKSRLIAEWRVAEQQRAAAPQLLRITPSSVPAAPLSGTLLWAEGSCLSYAREQPYHLLASLLHALLGVPRAAPVGDIGAALARMCGQLFGDQRAEVEPLLAHLLGLPLDPQASERVHSLDAQSLQARYYQAVRALLLAMAATRPLALVLEDVHWADPSSVELIARLLPLIGEAPMLFCIVMRADREVPGWRLMTAARDLLGGGLAEITLTALSEADSRQLVHNLLQIDALPEPVRERILRTAEGNPLFVEEVIRMLIDHGAITRAGDQWVAGAEIDHIEIPDTLQSLLQARIDRLPESVRHTLRVAAVIGRRFPARVLEQVLQKEGAE